MFQYIDIKCIFKSFADKGLQICLDLSSMNIVTYIMKRDVTGIDQITTSMRFAKLPISAE